MSRLALMQRSHTRSMKQRQILKHSIVQTAINIFMAKYALKRKTDNISRSITQIKGWSDYNGSNGVSLLA